MDHDVALRFLLGLVMLVGASVSDLRTRRVPNLYWIPFVAFAAILALGDVLLMPASRLVVAYGVAAALCALFYGLWKMRLFGGADAKALMVLACLQPWPRGGPVPLPAALDALANGSLLMLALPLLYAASNALRGRFAFPAMFLGTSMPVARAEASHVWPLQRVGRDGRVTWRFLHSAGEDVAATYQGLRTAGVATVWVTPKVPFMVPLTAGLAVSWQWGNLIVLGLSH